MTQQDLDALRRLGVPDVHAVNVGRLVNQAEEVAFVAPVETRRVIKRVHVEVLTLVSRLEIVDLDALATTARELRRFFRSFDGVRDVSFDLRPGKPEIVVQVRPGRERYSKKKPGSEK